MVDDDTEVAIVGDVVAVGARGLNAGIGERGRSICPTDLRGVEGTVDSRVDDCVANIFCGVQRKPRRVPDGPMGAAFAIT